MGFSLLFWLFSFCTSPSQAYSTCSTLLPHADTLSNPEPVSNPLTILQKHFLYSAFALGVLDHVLMTGRGVVAFVCPDFTRVSTFSSRIILFFTDHVSTQQWYSTYNSDQSTPTSQYNCIQHQYNNQLHFIYFSSGICKDRYHITRRFTTYDDGSTILHGRGGFVQSFLNSINRSRRTASSKST